MIVVGKYRQIIEETINNFLQENGVKILLHAFLDGRDVAQESALIYLNQTGVYKNLNPGSNVDLNDETTQDGSPQEC